MYVWVYVCVCVCVDGLLFEECVSQHEWKLMIESFFFQIMSLKLIRSVMLEVNVFYMSLFSIPLIVSVVVLILMILWLTRFCFSYFYFMFRLKIKYASVYSRRHKRKCSQKEIYWTVFLVKCFFFHLLCAKLCNIDRTNGFFWQTRFRNRWISAWQRRWMIEANGISEYDPDK